MDPRIAWCTPEQIGPAYKHWLRVWESSTGTICEKYQQFQEGDMIENTNPNRINLEKQQDFIPLQYSPKSSNQNRQDNSHRATDGHTGPSTVSVSVLSVGDGTNFNIASTYALNHSSNLAILERHAYIPWMIPNKRYPDHSIMCLHEEIKDFYNYMCPTAAEQCMRNQVVNNIRELIHRLWPQANVEVFGSFETDLYLPTSDIDLVVFGKWDTIPLWTLRDELLKLGIAEEETLKVLDKASVPIIKLIDKRTNVKVDISFNQINGVRSVNLIKEFLQLYPDLKYLVLVLKQYLLQRDLNEVYTGGIGSYCLLYLVISFLQMHPRHDARLGGNNLAVLLIEFFELYGRNFNYHKVGIRIQNGGSYIPKQQLTELHNSGVVPSFLYIEDPVNTANDVGKSSYGAYRVKESFEYAYTVLCRNTGYYTHGHSVLGRIIRVTKKVSEYRKWINTNFAPPSSCDYVSDEMMDDAADLSSSTCAIHRTSPGSAGKSYAKAVAMDSSLSKRSIASGPNAHMHTQGSGGESDCPTDASTTSPLSTPSASASSSSSLASDSDNDSISAPCDRIQPPKKAILAQRIPSAHKTVSVSTLTHKPIAKCSVASVKPSQSLNSAHPGSSQQPSNNNTSKGVTAGPLSSAASQTNKNTSNSNNTSNTNNSYGKPAYSKHSYSLTVHNSNSKQHTSNGSSASTTAATNPSPAQSTTAIASIQPNNRINHKQTVSKRRKTTTTQPASVNKGNSGRSISR